MSGFCTRCGAPLQAGSAFCTGCGAAAVQSPSPATTAPSPSGSPLLKFVLIGFGVLCMIGILALGAVVYAGYRVKRSVERYAQRNGFELSDLGSSQTAARRPDPCSLLTAGEAGQILGLPIVRATASGDACQYFRQPGATAQQSQAFQQALQEGSRHPAGKAGDSASPRDLVRQNGAEEMVKNMIGAANDGSAPYLVITVHPDGKSQMAAVKLAMGAMGGSQFSESLAGIGDQAYLGPMDSMMWFLKNGIAVEIDLRLVPKGRVRGIELARRMLPRL